MSLTPIETEIANSEYVGSGTMKEWIGEKFVPEKLSVDKVNNDIKQHH